LQALNYSKSCKEEWPKTCFTNIPMLDFLIRLNGQTWDDFLKDPTFKDKKGLEEKILISSEDDLKPLWQEGHGLCTSWCIYISDKVFGPHTIENFGDQGRHRAAFGNDGVLIDSSARDALLCREGGKETFRQTTWDMEDIGQIGAKLFSVRKFNAC
jgi:hypothetical protein